MRMLWFSERKRIENLFNAWAEENGVAKVPNSVVAFLDANGCLDEVGVREWLNREANGYTETVSRELQMKGRLNRGANIEGCEYG